MSLLPQFFNHSVVFIESGDGLGTGFILGLLLGRKDAEGRDLYKTYLVTNRHVVSDQHPTIVRLDTIGGVETAVIPKADSNWFYPADPDLDIAMIGLDWSYLEKIKSTTIFVAEDNAISDAETFLKLIKPGQEVFLLGFPLGMKGVQQNHPVVRQGIVARNDQDLLSINQFYLDINNFPGNSGGPVFVKPSNTSLSGEQPLNKSILIGFVSAYVPYQKTLFDITTNPPTPKMVMEENSGIAIAIPIFLAIQLARERLEKSVKAQESEAQKLTA